MNKLELNDLHIDVLAELLNKVKKKGGISIIQYNVVDDILGLIHMLQQGTHIDDIAKFEALLLRVEAIESNINAHRNTEYVGLLKRIDELESLVYDLTTVCNKHSIKGSDDSR